MEISSDMATLKLISNFKILKTWWQTLLAIIMGRAKRQGGIANTILGITLFYSLVCQLRRDTNHRQHDPYGDSPASSDYSTGSTFLVNTTTDKNDETEEEGKQVENSLQINHTGEISRADEHKKEILSSAVTEPG